MAQDNETMPLTVRMVACVAILRQDAGSFDEQIHQGDFIGFDRLGTGPGRLFFRVGRRRRG
jgi:hypothetical protein